MKKAGRPKKEPTTVIAIPMNRLAAVSKILGREVAANQMPIVKVRIPTCDVEKIRKIIRNE